jgi:hypothetical protein
MDLFRNGAIEKSGLEVGWPKSVFMFLHMKNALKILNTFYSEKGV